MRQAGVVSYLHGDHLNSASLATTAGGGQVVDSPTRYYPYDGTRSDGSGMPTEYRYTGQRREAGLGGLDGLYFYSARWYDPSLGRFLSADTLVPGPGNPQSLNRYAYTLGNPLKYVDPTGHAAACDESPTLCGGFSNAESLLRRIGNQGVPWDRLNQEQRNLLGRAGWDPKTYNSEFVTSNGFNVAGTFADPAFDILLVAGAWRAVPAFRWSAGEPVPTDRRTSGLQTDTGRALPRAP